VNRPAAEAVAFVRVRSIERRLGCLAYDFHIPGCLRAAAAPLTTEHEELENGLVSSVKVLDGEPRDFVWPLTEVVELEVIEDMARGDLDGPWFG
jgi:hypothetical protein